MHERRFHDAVELVHVKHLVGIEANIPEPNPPGFQEHARVEKHQRQRRGGIAPPFRSKTPRTTPRACHVTSAISGACVSRSSGRGKFGPAAMRRPTELNRAFATARSAVSVSEDTGEAYEAPGILRRGTRAGAARGEVWLGV